jgi:hypothetical protein
MARSIGAARMHDLVLSEALFLISIPGRAPNDPRLIGLGVVCFLPAPVTCSCRASTALLVVVIHRSRSHRRHLDTVPTTHAKAED